MRRAQVHMIVREWFIGLTCFSLVIAPVGCQVGPVLGEDLASETESETTGMFLNEDASSPAVIAGQTDAGDAYFVYGSRNSAGGIAQIDSIYLVTPDGQQSYLVFESGRPVYARGHNGSYIQITYDSVTIDRLAGSANVYDASTGETTTYAVDVNPAQSLDEVAALVESTTGLAIVTLDPADLTAKSLNAQTKITIFSPFFALLVLPFVAVVAFATIILGQILAAIYAIVAAVIKIVLVAILAPIFVIGKLLNSTIVSIKLLPLTTIFAFIPPPPTVIIVD